MNELNTKNLEKTELEIMVDLLKEYVAELKNDNHNGDLFTYCYRSKSEEIINMEQFIKKSIQEALIAEKSESKWNNPFMQESLLQQAKEKLIVRLKNKFEFASGPPIKVLNSFLSYVGSTVKSSVRNYLKKLRQIELKNDEKYKMLDEYDDTKLSYKVLGSKLSTPEQDLISNENEQEIYKCIDQLTEKQRKVLILNRVRGMSQKEIALKLGISQQAVSKLLDKALDNLKQILLDRKVALKYKYYFVS